MSSAAVVVKRVKLTQIHRQTYQEKKQKQTKHVQCNKIYHFKEILYMDVEIFKVSYQLNTTEDLD